MCKLKHKNTVYPFNIRGQNMSELTSIPLHRFRHNQNAIKYSNAEWQSAQDHSLLNRQVKYIGNSRVEDQNGHKFINMISCSYLGLEFDKRILQGAKNAIDKSHTLMMCSSRLRVREEILDETEDELTDLFQIPAALTHVSCGVHSCGVLPLITSGHITDTPPLVTVFDKHAHLSLNIAKPICADEGGVITSPHNDLNFLEDVCKKYPNVAYVCDGIYSLGDKAPIKSLLELQNKYGLFLYIDDSHGLSVYGKNGEGFARSSMPGLNERTMIVASLYKGFGAKGSLLMFGAKDKKELIKRYGGGFAWSQYLSTADCGAILASAKIHRSSELNTRQQKLQTNIKHFDRLVTSLQNGNDFSIRLIRIGAAESAINIAGEIFKQGFYTTAAFFPVVARGQAGLRINLRADIPEEDITRLGQVIKNTVNQT